MTQKTATSRTSNATAYINASVALHQALSTDSNPNAPADTKAIHTMAQHALRDGAWDDEDTKKSRIAQFRELFDRQPQKIQELASILIAEAMAFGEWNRWG